ncbi:hypothetical protein HHK36_006893 [Tetracentron sinense]|uniref:F-box domain-containing protein n=1 Tax=Tetracentron sinense TaxID=13715 RepID=A0A834ZJU6_TETSI|nr:hypothetical protein HHK36_006893 [Tetracentron sinense]
METPHRRSSDIISNLPDQVIETILAYWPIQDAVQTSLLSNKWRYKWNLIPTLVFHEERTHFPPDTKAFASNKIVNFVDRVLLQHKGSIHKFELSTHSLQDYVIDSWLLFLSKNGVKELVLQFLSRDRYCDQHFGQGKVSNLVRGLGCLTALEKLVIGECFMEFLAMGILPKRLLVTYDRLKSISLFINFNDLNQSLAMLFLFQSSPNLQELKMLANQVAATEYVVDFWKALGHLNCSMNHLRMVKIIMWGAKSELELIKFLLANSPVLEILSVNHITSEKVDESRVLKELVRFPRASTKAQIEYK